MAKCRNCKQDISKSHKQGKRSRSVFCSRKCYEDDKKGIAYYKGK